MAVSCRALGVSQAWFFKWRTRDRSPRRKRRAALAATIAYLSANHSGTYGSPRIAADLHAMNWRVSKSTVATLMAEAGVLARRKRRRRGTATPDKSARTAPDGLRRDFTPDAAAGRALVPGSHRNPHRRRQTPPISATVLDLYSRRSDRYPTLDGAPCPAHAQRRSLRRSSVRSLRIQWLNDALSVHLVGAHERVCATIALI